jgi:hypothetical protein
MEPVRSYCPTVIDLPRIQGGSARFEACSAGVYSHYSLLAEWSMQPFYTEDSISFITSTVASVATWRSETSSRVGLAPAADRRLFTAHSNQWLTLTTVNSIQGT